MSATASDFVVDSSDDDMSRLGPVDMDNGSLTDMKDFDFGEDDDVGISNGNAQYNVSRGSGENDLEVFPSGARDNYEDDPVDDEANDIFVDDVPMVGWWRQLCVILWYKNRPFLQRKLVHMLILLFSGVASVLIAWPAGRDYDADKALYPPAYTDCGTVPDDFLAELNSTEIDKVKLSLNDKWQNGLPVAVLSLGPLLSAIVTYLIVHEELQLHVFGVLRGLGMPDSVYWMSWYIPFAAIALINSILAGITAKTLPIHVFDATYFFGIVGAFFFLQLALMGSSFFLAAVSGTAKRGAVWLILVMIIATWIPFLILSVQRPLGSSLTGFGITTFSPTGLFWVNSETAGRDFIAFDNANLTRCNVPILSEQEGSFYKTQAEQEDVTPDQFFLGCYASAGFGSTAWAPIRKTKFGIAVLWFFPYFHFNTVWGNFCGLTGNPNKEFGANHARMTSGELAREGLVVAPSQSNALGTTLFPQGSMLQVKQVYDFVC